MRNRVIHIRSRVFAEGVEISSKAVEYSGYIQTPVSMRDIQMYGERITRIKTGLFTNREVCDIENAYPVSRINEGDLAYIDTTPNGEKEDGDNADYVVRSVLVGAAFTSVTFEKIQQE